MWITAGVSTQGSHPETRPSPPEPLVERPELIQMAIAARDRSRRGVPARRPGAASRRAPRGPRAPVGPGDPDQSRLFSWFA